MPNGRVEARRFKSPKTLFNLEDILCFFMRSRSMCRLHPHLSAVWPFPRTFHAVPDGPVAKCLGTAMCSGAYDYRPS